MPASASTEALWRQLRARHPRFVYESFSLEPRDDGLRLRFHFRIEPDIEFAPEMIFERVDWERAKRISRNTLENLVFHLGLVEMLSYWKAASSPEIVVRAGKLDAEQTAWWLDLLRHGMGEYFYVNQIDCRATDFVKIRSLGKIGSLGFLGSLGEVETEGIAAKVSPRAGRDLVLTSGGKDSVVTLEILREALSATGREFDCLMLNPTEAALAVARQAGCASPLVIRRTIDERLLELNRRGYLNGHTPFSALLAMLGVTVAALGGYRNVIVANERSAEEAGVEYLGEPINHQYSKTYRYETKFREYCQRYLVPYEKQVLRFAQDDSEGIEYFSLMRPLYELQIARRFAGYPQYFSLFKSCNRGMATNSWCGRCPKCLFVWTALYPFVEREQALGIFGQDLFAGEGAAEVLGALLGLDEHKPFECVGTKEETLAAIHLCVEKYRKEGLELPPALGGIEESVLSKRTDLPEVARRVLGAWNEEHFVPEELIRRLRR
ncbi:MAG: hypothetical protein A3H27_10180 [Acidobacteria bacterium RIFCSPLOWO2_02_FULL_59_13]|nr:MAG: hypothetical protein A3H27_10180 [Acidobacteria bacterium RIFCSPLOWO2_02_FULL_59_13]